MKLMLRLSLFPVFLLSSLVLRAAVPDTLTFADLSGHPERWPATVTMPRALSFQGGAAVKKGQVVKVVDLERADVVVDAGADLVFTIPAKDCGFVEAANKAWSTLTPEQRAVDEAALRQDASLWPMRAKAFAEFTLKNGTRMPAGDEYEVIGMEPEGAVLYSRQYDATLQVAIKDTDMIARARELALVPAAKRPSRIAALLQGKLVNAKGESVSPAGLETVQVFALYYGASWCGPCRKFSPGFVEYVQRVSAENPNFAVVLMSNDKDDNAMLGYMTEEKMPWPALPLSAIKGSPQFLGYMKGYIPQLVIVDRAGKVLADSYRGKNYIGPAEALRGLDELLTSGAAR